MITQKEIILPPYARGMHLITKIIEDQLDPLPSTALVNLFIKHTSASITINENADPDVITDFVNYINRLVPDDTPYFRHIDEGTDDMPSHIKSSLLGSSLTIPVKFGKLNLGMWQGIYLCEHRNNAGNRVIVATIYS